VHAKDRNNKIYILMSMKKEGSSGGYVDIKKLQNAFTEKIYDLCTTSIKNIINIF